MGVIHDRNFCSLYRWDNRHSGSRCDWYLRQDWSFLSNYWNDHWNGGGISNHWNWSRRGSDRDNRQSRGIMWHDRDF